MESKDIFDAALKVEEGHIREGYDAGIEHGRVLGHTEGRRLGLAKGFEIGQEIGYYAGAVARIKQDEPSAKVQALIVTLERLIEQFPKENSQDERIHDMVDTLRGKFAILSATTGLQTDRHSASITTQEKFQF